MLSTLVGMMAACARCFARFRAISALYLPSVSVVLGAHVGFLVRLSWLGQPIMPLEYSLVVATPLSCCSLRWPNTFFPNFIVMFLYSVGHGGGTGSR